MHRGERVDPTPIRNCGLMTVEGEKDDITGVGQTQAAQELCVNIPAARKQHYLQLDVGHFGCSTAPASARKSRRASANSLRHRREAGDAQRPRKTSVEARGRRDLQTNGTRRSRPTVFCSQYSEAAQHHRSRLNLRSGRIAGCLIEEFPAETILIGTGLLGAFQAKKPTLGRRSACWWGEQGASDRRVDRPRPDQFFCCSTVIETLRSAVTPAPRKFPMNA